jgi:hypothetical protein
VVFGYERKGFVKLKEYFKVSKTKDHYQQFDSLCLLIFFSCRFSLICSFFFYQGILTLFWLSLFLVIWECLIAFELFWALLPFWFSHGFFIIFILEISLAPSVGCDPSQDFS